MHGQPVYRFMLPCKLSPNCQILDMLAPDSIAAADAEFLQGESKERWQLNATAADPLFNQAGRRGVGKTKGAVIDRETNPWGASKQGSASVHRWPTCFHSAGLHCGVCKQPRSPHASIPLFLTVSFYSCRSFSAPGPSLSTAGILQSQPHATASRNL